MADFDLAIVGGGINGVGIARDAAGRGLRVLLVEQNDLASGTSSASTKMIHGGLRYLEHGAFKLVREALTERETLLRVAPHTIRPLRLVLPATGPRPAWMVRLGLFIYDRLGRRDILPGTRTLDLARDPAGVPLKPRFRTAFEYSDCWADDSRLVVLNALDAAERGAAIRTRTKLVAAERHAEWRLTLDARGTCGVATAQVLVNAAGPWVGVVSQSILRLPERPPLRLAKGTHIVVPKLFDHDRGYFFQNADKRIVFALPFHDDFTVIGTTDQNFSGDLDALAPEPAEIGYLCESANAYFRTPVEPAQVKWAFAGVRALYDDGAGNPEDISRDYRLVLDGGADEAPLLTVYGGKITTYRRLAEAALAHLAKVLPIGPSWTATAALPGGDFGWNELDAKVAQARRRWPFLAEREAQRMVRAYGTRLDRILGDAKTRESVGPWFGTLCTAELRHLVTQEWARTADDVLWRRTKLGLRLTPDEIEMASAAIVAQASNCA